MQRVNIVCSIHDFPYNTHNKMSPLQAAAIIQERLMCRHAVAKVRLLFESSLYSRAGFIQDCTVHLLYITSVVISTTHLTARAKVQVKSMHASHISHNTNTKMRRAA